MGDKNLHREWVDKHRETLLETGVPVAVFEDELAWNLFLEDGEFTASGKVPFGVDVELLAKENAMILCDFLAAEFPERSTDRTSPYRALNRLEFLFKRGPHAT